MKMKKKTGGEKGANFVGSWEGGIVGRNTALYRIIQRRN